MKEKLRHIKQYLKTHKKTIIVLAIIKLLIKLSIVGYLLLGATECSAQSTNKLIRSGNKLYNNQKYNNATDQYSKALQKDPKNGTAYFNQSDAFYQLKEYQKAQDQFKTIAASNAKPEIKAKAYHNLGNSFYKQEKYEESIKAYKNALKINPGDKDTKYNLMMAMAKLKQKGGGGKSQQQQQQQNNQQQQQQQQQQNKAQMSEDQAKRLLESLNNEENKVKEKLEKKKEEPKSANGKDW